MYFVAIEQPSAIAKAKYETAEAAEMVARRIVRSGLKPEMSIWRQADEHTPAIGRRFAKYPEHVATVLIDALDRVWTQVSSAPGQRAFL